jgi:hypothetical protein
MNQYFKECAERWMNFVMNISLKVLPVYLLVLLNKRKGKVLICNYAFELNSFRNGIYPSWKCSFDVYEGAENNLPDQAAMKTAQYIQTMISNTMSTDDILLVLISGDVFYGKEDDLLFINI